MRYGRGKLGALLAALVATALLASVVVWRFDRLRAWWWNATRGVAVVRTWEDLRSQPAIELENGARVRLGIEASMIRTSRIASSQGGG